jgi:hypothetical protein
MVLNKHSSLFSQSTNSERNVSRFEYRASLINVPFASNYGAATFSMMTFSMITLSITTFSIITLNRKGLFWTPSIMDVRTLSINDT